MIEWARIQCDYFENEKFNTVAISLSKKFKRTFGANLPALIYQKYIFETTKCGVGDVRKLQMSDFMCDYFPNEFENLTIRQIREVRAEIDTQFVKVNLLNSKFQIDVNKIKKFNPGLKCVSNVNMDVNTMSASCQQQCQHDVSNQNVDIKKQIRKLQNAISQAKGRLKKGLGTEENLKKLQNKMSALMSAMSATFADVTNVSNDVSIMSANVSGGIKGGYIPETFVKENKGERERESARAREENAPAAPSTKIFEGGQTQEHAPVPCHAKESHDVDFKRRFTGLLSDLMIELKKLREFGYLCTTQSGVPYLHHESKLYNMLYDPSKYKVSTITKAIDDLKKLQFYYSSCANNSELSPIIDYWAKVLRENTSRPKDMTEDGFVQMHELLVKMWKTNKDYAFITIISFIQDYYGRRRLGRNGNEYLVDHPLISDWDRYSDKQRRNGILYYQVKDLLPHVDKLLELKRQMDVADKNNDDAESNRVYAEYRNYFDINVECVFSG